MQRRQALYSLAALPGLTAGQGSGPVRLWVGTTPGGSTDTIAREIAPEMGRQLGRTVIVENRSGAGGNLAADGVAKSPPDGNNLLVSFTSHTINASLYKRLPFDPVADFTPLTMLSTSTSVLVCHPDQPYRNVAELIAYARTRPGRLSMGLGGIGSSVHLAGEAFKLQARLFIVNIPYRGTAPAVADVVAGNLPLMFAPLVNTRGLVQAGKLRLLGVKRSPPPKRLRRLPPGGNASGPAEPVPRRWLAGPLRVSRVARSAVVPEQPT